MNLMIFLFLLLVGTYTIAARPLYLEIHSDRRKLIELSPATYSEVSMVRVPRDTEAIAAVQTEDDGPVSRIERPIIQIRDYIDFGGHTGEDGAFGWYADFPAQ